MSPILVLQTAVISHSTMRKIYSIIQYTLHLIMMLQNINIKSTQCNWLGYCQTILWSRRAKLFYFKE